MATKFGHLYEELVELEKGINQLSLDIANANCDYASKCIMEDELAIIRAQYDSMLDTDLDFKHMDFKNLISKVQECLSCVNLGFDPDEFDDIY